MTAVGITDTVDKGSVLTHSITKTYMKTSSKFKMKDIMKWRAREKVGIGERDKISSDEIIGIEMNDQDRASAPESTTRSDQAMFIPIRLNTLNS